jgi:hypothetical protein
MRPDFACFLAGCHQREITAGVTTFSTQKELIARVLGGFLLPLHTEILVAGGNDVVQGYEEGKQSQLLLFVRRTFYSTGRDDEVKMLNTPEAGRRVRSMTLLVDDDPHNIEIARRDGYATILYEPGTTTSLLDAIDRFVEERKRLTTTTTDGGANSGADIDMAETGANDAEAAAAAPPPPAVAAVEKAP